MRKYRQHLERYLTQMLNKCYYEMQKQIIVFLEFLFLPSFLPPSLPFFLNILLRLLFIHAIHWSREGPVADVSPEPLGAQAAVEGVHSGQGWGLQRCWKGRSLGCSQLFSLTCSQSVLFLVSPRLELHESYFQLFAFLPVMKRPELRQARCSQIWVFKRMCHNWDNYNHFLKNL